MKVVKYTFVIAPGDPTGEQLSRMVSRFAEIEGIHLLAWSDPQAATTEETDLAEDLGIPID